jgi:hypothetical protein
LHKQEPEGHSVLVPPDVLGVVAVA